MGKHMGIIGVCFSYWKSDIKYTRCSDELLQKLIDKYNNSLPYEEEQFGIFLALSELKRIRDREE